MQAKAMWIVGSLAIAVSCWSGPASALCDAHVLDIAFGACRHECDVKNKVCDGLKTALNHQPHNYTDVRNELAFCVNAAPINVRQNVENCFTGSPGEKEFLFTEGCKESDCKPEPPPAPPQSAPKELLATAVHATGTAWQVVFQDDVTDEFLSGFSLEVYITPQQRLPFFTTEMFVTRQQSGNTSTIKILFDDRSNPPISPTQKPTVHLHHPAP